MKRILPLLMALLLVLSLAACGSGATAPQVPEVNGGSYFTQDGWDMETPAISSENKSESADHSKMIFRADIDLETLEFDAALESITNLVSGADGYFEQQELANYSSGYRYARLVVRVPSQRFDDFCRQVGDVCHTVRLNTTQENVSESYYDVESRLNTAKTKLARLQELLAQAETMDDIITIESAISDTEQTIDYLSGTLRGYDNLVDYATVCIDLDEVYRFTGAGEAPLTLGQRLLDAFRSGLASIRDFFEGFLVFLAYAWFWLLLIAAVIIVIVRLLRGKRIFRRKKKHSAADKSDETKN